MLESYVLQYRCFRYTFSEDDKLQGFDSGYFVSDATSTKNDCIDVFWTREELASIRKSQEDLAAAGDQAAAWIMAEEYGDTGPLSKIALSTEDIALARTLAVEYNDHGPLAELAARDTKTEKELGLSSRSRKPQLTSLAALSDDEIDRLAEEGDPEAQFQRYLSIADSDPLEWLCRAADNGHPSAQYRLGTLYWFGDTELERNLLLSYKWHRLSAAKGTQNSMRALVYVEAAMSPAQLSQAQQLYIDWAPGQCAMEIEQNRIRN
jgi:hypothetical protein